MLAIRLLEEGATSGPDVSWLIWVVLIAFVSMVFLGWWASKRLPVEQEPVQVQEEHGHEEHH
jgi:FtsZ-interacting cell division protein ZipA